MSLPHPQLLPTIYVGTFIHTPSLGELEILENSIIRVDASGIIVGIQKNVLPSVDEREKDPKWEGCINRLTEDWELIQNTKEEVRVERGRLDGSGWWCPGFVGRQWLLFSS